MMETGALKKHLRKCHIESYWADGYVFESKEGLFHKFKIQSSIMEWDTHDGHLGLDVYSIVFPKTTVRIRFSNNSILMVFRSGHIRYLSEKGFIYYAILTDQRMPDFIQGDLIIMKLNDKGLNQKVEQLTGMLRLHQKVFWYTPLMPDNHEFAQKWTDAKELFIGGNRKHKVEGALKYYYPVLPDFRTVQVKTEEQLVVTHDPIDHIHPTCFLEANQTYLFSKLSGYSDPIMEMNSEIIEALRKAD
jgi:hypothetical protein